MVRTALRYLSNMVVMVAHQHGYGAAMSAGGRFLAAEVAKLPKLAFLLVARRLLQARAGAFPPMHSPAILAALAQLDVILAPYQIDVAAFRSYMAAGNFPRNYAGGPLSEGGFREQKLLEYFVSLDFLGVKAGDIVLDVGSQWAIFPQRVHESTGATVYQQDLVFAPGITGRYIGGSAAHMPLPDGFADKIVLHNAFEHFEGTADSDFIREAWRVLKPGGILCILPLFVSDRFRILTDPLVKRPPIAWDEGARIVQIPQWRNRFGRFYDAAALWRRVLAPAVESGFEATLYHAVNVKQVEPRAHLYFALVLCKPPITASIPEVEPAARHEEVAGATVR